MMKRMDTDVLPRMRRRNGDQLEGLSSVTNQFYKLIAEHVVWTSKAGNHDVDALAQTAAGII